MAFSSAGTFAADGTRATSVGMAAAAELGLDLSSHRATRLTTEVLDGIDLVYGMEQEHLVTLPAAGPALRVELLSPDGAGIPDPYGGDSEDYRACYSLIREALAQRLEEWN